MRKKTDIKSHIVANSFPNPFIGCWIWMKACVPRGYGSLLSGHAHRHSYIAFKGAVPEGLEIRHLCNNPPCCNPAHLEAGTHTQNMRDVTVAKAWPDRKGEAHPRARLTANDVRRIRELLAEGKRCAEVAREFNMSWSAIDEIKKGKRWNHI